MDKIAVAKRNTQTKESTEAAVIRNLRGEKSLRDCAEYLNENVPGELKGAHTTFASIHNWENSENGVSDACLLAWQIFYPAKDARNQAALRILTLRKRASAAVPA